LPGYPARRWPLAFKAGVGGTPEIFFGALSSWRLFNDLLTAGSLIGGFLFGGGVVVLAASPAQRRSAGAGSPTPNRPVGRRSWGTPVARLRGPALAVGL
jgi:hypothetical protein